MARYLLLDPFLCFINCHLIFRLSLFLMAKASSSEQSLLHEHSPLCLGSVTSEWNLEMFLDLIAWPSLSASLDWCDQTCSGAKDSLLFERLPSTFLKSHRRQTHLSLALSWGVRAWDLTSRHQSQLFQCHVASRQLKALVSADLIDEVLCWSTFLDPPH